MLEKLHVIDYSLLMGVHFTRWGNAAWYPPFLDWPSDGGAAAAAAAAAGGADGGGTAEGSEAASSRPITPVGSRLPPTAVADAVTAACGGEGSLPPSIPAMLAAASSGTWQLSSSDALGSPPVSPAAVAAEQYEQLLASGSGEVDGMAAPLSPRWVVNEHFRRRSSIDAADALAALIESLELQQAQTPQSPAQAPQQQQPAAGEPDELQQAAASVVQSANLSRAQARVSATAALRSAAGGAAVPPLPPIAEAAAGEAEADGSDASVAADVTTNGAVTPSAPPVEQGVQPMPSASAASPAAPLVAVADRGDPEHWWLDRSCGLSGAVCLSGARCLRPAVAGLGEQCEQWVHRPQLPGELATVREEEGQACFLLSDGGGGLGGLGPEAVREQQQQLDRLLSRRDSGTGALESAGRAVPAVAVRRSASGAPQYEPVLLYFGIIDFLQVSLSESV